MATVQEKYPIVEEDKYPIVEEAAAEKYPVVTEPEPAAFSRGQAEEMLGLAEPEPTPEEEFQAKITAGKVRGIPGGIVEAAKDIFGRPFTRKEARPIEERPEEIRTEQPERVTAEIVKGLVPGVKLAEEGRSPETGMGLITDIAGLFGPWAIGKVFKTAGGRILKEEIRAAAEAGKKIPSGIHGQSIRKIAAAQAAMQAAEEAATPAAQATPSKPELAQIEREFQAPRPPPDLSGKQTGLPDKNELRRALQEQGEVGPQELERFLAQKEAEAGGVMTGSLPPAPSPKKTPYREPTKVIGREPEGGITSPVEVVPGPPSKPVGEGWVKSGEKAAAPYGVEVREAAANRSQGLGYAEVKKGADQGLRQHEVAHELIERAQKALDPETFSATITDKISQKSWDRAEREVKGWGSLRRDQQIDEAFAREVQYANTKQQGALLGGIDSELARARGVRAGEEITKGIHYGPADIERVEPTTPERIRTISKHKTVQADAATPEWPYVPTADIYLKGAKPEAIITGGKTPHVVDLKGKKFYDLDKDPSNLQSIARKLAANEGQPGNIGLQENVMFNQMKAEGWDGFKVPSQNQVRLFTEAPIIKPGPPGSPGFIQVEAIRDITGTAVGATTGAMVDEENAWRGGVVGGALGLVMTHGIGKTLSKGKYPKGTKFVKGGIEVPPIREPGTPLRSLEDIPPQLAPTKEIVGKTAESMAIQGIKRDPNMLFSQQVMDEVIKDPKNYRQISDKFGFFSPAEMIRAAKGKLSESAQFMQGWSEASKKLIKESPEAAQILNKIAKGKIGLWDHLQDWYQKVDNIRKGLMVSQVATAMRNVETQGLRVMMEIPEKATEAVLQKMFRTKDTVKWSDGLEEVMGLFHRNKKFADEALANYPKEYSRMFGTFSSDVSTIAGKGWSYANKGVEVLNVLNRGQEFMIRRAVMMGELNAVARNKGLDLAKMMKEGASLSDILSAKEAEALVDKSLEITFAKNPEYGSMAQKFISAMHFPGASYVVPFPRFMVNALKFNFEYSPAGFVKLVKPSEWAKMGQGDFKTIARASIGSAMFYGAYQIRNSEYAGDLPWEFKWGAKDQITGEQTVWDTRAYNPFMNYFVMADLTKRWSENRWHTVTASMVAQGLLGTSMKMRTVGTIVDDVLQGLWNASGEEGDNDQKRTQRLREYAGDLVGSWSVPMQTVKDLYDVFEASPYFDKSESPIAQEFTTKVPGYAGEPLYSPTSAGPIMREAPAKRQLAGVSLKTKNVFQQELDRFGVKASDIFKSTGIREADNIIKKSMGTMSQELVVPFIQSSDYKELDKEEQDYILREIAKDLRINARQELDETRPDLALRLKAGKIPAVEKRLYKSQGLDINKEIEAALK